MKSVDLLKQGQKFCCIKKNKKKRNQWSDGYAPNSEQEYLAPGAKTLVGAVKQQYSWNEILDLFYTILHSSHKPVFKEYTL